jgi:hypothetical protein
VYGSGFPKSLNISKAIDKAAGAEREVIGQIKRGSVANAKAKGAGYLADPANRNNQKQFGYGLEELTTAATDEAKEWDGWGTALKPAHEPIVMARKPLDGTVANNVLTYGVGGININGCRVESDEVITNHSRSTESAVSKGKYGDSFAQETHQTDGQALGRFPANFIHDGSDEVLELFPDTGKSTGGRIGKKQMSNVTNVPAGQYEAGDPGYGDSGSAARFFYCAKASKKDRNEGLDGFEAKEMGRNQSSLDGGQMLTGSGNIRSNSKLNHHPTVKPTDLMRYLCRLVTPPNGTVLDPFTGSGSTGKAAVLEGFNFIGIEQSAEYVEIAKARITK